MNKENIIKLRDYFKEHDKTPFEHWAYTFLNNQLLTLSPTGDRDCEELKKKADYWGEQWVLANQHFKKAQQRISELEKGLDAIINSCNYKDEIEFKHNAEWNMSYWTPAGIMIETEPFYKAKQLLNKHP